MSFNNLMPYPAPQKITIKDVQGDTRIPYERIKSYDDKEFELFIREWVTSLSERYQIRGFGGAGDKGRDVVAKDSQGKHYKSHGPVAAQRVHGLNLSNLLLIYYFCRNRPAIRLHREGCCESLKTLP